MTTAVAAVAFVTGALVSLGTSWFLVTRIERIGARFGASEVMLGLMAALAADAPEISASISALGNHQHAIGVGVILGSNIFNLAALLGLGAIVARSISLHRRVVVLEGAVAMWVAGSSILVVLHVVNPPEGFAVAAAALIPYIGLTALNGAQRRVRSGSGRSARWLSSAIAQEEQELEEAIRPPRGRPVDLWAAAVALVVVVIASVAMERAASRLGHRWSVPDVLVGTLVLAGVTSLPNAVAAVYLARRGRGAASLSTAMNSNAFNVAVGLFIPAVVLGIGPAMGAVTMIAIWYAGLTAFVLIAAYVDRGLRRTTGALIVAAYAGFVGAVIAGSG